MPYLILHDGTTPFNAGRISAKKFNAATMRTALEKRYPGKLILNPMERFIAHRRDTTKMVTVYLSPNKDGHGRWNTLHGWLVVYI